MVVKTVTARLAKGVYQGATEHVADRNNMNGSTHTSAAVVSPGGRVTVDGRFFQRAGKPLRVRGVTYGPFAPNDDGDHFPDHIRVVRDLQMMREAAINAIRTYYVPPDWFLETASEQGMLVLVDVPWPKHLCFLDSVEAQRIARELVHEAAVCGRRHPCILGYSIANEVPPDVIRWHGPDRVQKFLGELTDISRQADPEGLVTIANFPSAEYLELPFLDFATFNVYLHDPDAFRRYLGRLLNQVGDRPLLLGEIGMDTFRHDAGEQAAFLSEHLREAAILGLAGSFVFAWTDDWFTGGHQIEDWAFGLTDIDRRPKASLQAVASVYHQTPTELLPETPRVSVVVCSYNGGRTLEQCLNSLLTLDYPDYEVILVDDGSTDNTRAIVARFPAVNAIHQTNQGLSIARNVGLAAATGSIIAYTDSDCFADPYWLTHLVYPLVHSTAAGVGGPNLTPDDGWLAACVAAAPGQPCQVLESDVIAEHVPGCNMAFQRQALEDIGGFDARYIKAGDDVDLCWRLRDAGHTITFAPGAFVWHHRRQDPKAFLRQQAGYGEAEGMLWLKFPSHFTGRGGGKWRGTLYGTGLAGLRLRRAPVFRGVFGTGLFQIAYTPQPSHWAAFPGTLEWHLTAAAFLLGGVSICPTAFDLAQGLAAIMIALSLLVAAILARQAKLAPQYDSVRSRFLVAVLCYVQPLIRSWWRYRTRLFPPAAFRLHTQRTERTAVSLWGIGGISYWDEAWRERVEFLAQAAERLREKGWSVVVENGWTDSDIVVSGHPWTAVRLVSAQEDHGSGRRLFRLRYRLNPGAPVAGIALAGIGAAVAAAVTLTPVLLVHASAALLMAFVLWGRGRMLASQAAAVVDELAAEWNLVRCVEQPDHALRSGNCPHMFARLYQGVRKSLDRLFSPPSQEEMR